MMFKLTRPTRCLIAASAMLALSACEIKQQRSDADPDPEASEAASAEPTPASTSTGVSILRPEVEQPAAFDPADLDPLETVVSLRARGQ